MAKENLDPTLGTVETLLALAATENLDRITAAAIEKLAGSIDSSLYRKSVSSLKDRVDGVCKEIAGKYLQLIPKGFRVVLVGGVDANAYFPKRRRPGKPEDSLPGTKDDEEVAEQVSKSEPVATT